MNKLLLIDTFNFLHRAYHALPKTFTDVNGEPTNAVYGVTSMIISAIDLVKPTHIVAALDGMKPTFRVEEFTQYKAHRSEMDPDLASQIPKVFEIIDAFGVYKKVLEGYEADDIIGTMATKYASPTTQVIIISNDRDMWQLVNKNVVIMVPTSGGAADWIGEKEVLARMEFGPEHITDYKGLRGDPSDNIPGVYGIGEKTAKKLIAELGGIEDIYKHIDKVNPESLRQKLMSNYENAMNSKKLATIIKDAPIGIELEDCKYKGYDSQQAFDVLTKFRFKSLSKRIGLDEKYKVKEEGENKVSVDQPSLF